MIGNTLQTTVAGVYATWYFLSGTPAMPPHPIRDSAKRALTYSFGSICLGSLMVAALRTLRLAIALMSNKRSVSGAVADTLLADIEALVERFNYYTYTSIAIHGKPFVQAAGDTFKLLSAKGVDVVAGDNYIGASAFILSLAIALASGVASSLAVRLVSPVTAHDMSSVWPVVCGSMYALVVCAALFEIVTAGGTATFVCLAEDPQALRRTQPALYAALRAAHPDALVFE